MEAAVCITRTVAAHSRCFRGTFQYPTSQAEREGFVQCIHPSKQQLCASGARDCWSLLSLLSLCSSEVGQTKSIAGLCPQLPGTVYSFHTQPFSKDKTSFQVQELRKKNPFGINSGKVNSGRKQKMVSLKNLRCYEFWEGHSGTVKCDCERPFTVWECSRLTPPAKCRLRKGIWENFFQLRSGN